MHEVVNTLQIEMNYFAIIVTTHPPDVQIPV